LLGRAYKYSYLGFFIVNVLIVEPSKTYSLLLEELLRGYSVTPILVTNTPDALIELKNNTFDFICISMQLTDMTGIELSTKIKSDASNKNPLTIVLSSETDANKFPTIQKDEANYICQKMDIDSLKNLFSSLTQNEIIKCERSGHVLYVEDHLSVANMTMEILKQMGLSITHYIDADTALAAFDTTDFDLVLLDIILPGNKDGIEVIKSIRTRTDEKSLIPILALSGKLNSTQRIDALKKGANDFITKPVIQAELAARVNNLVLAHHLYLQVKQQQHALEQVAMTDHLTGLYNRHFLMPFVEKALTVAKRQNHNVSLVMIDLDNFKPINDQLGHETGDEVLIAVANILQASTRVEDIAVRLGGDEFLMVLPYCNLEQAKEKAEKVRRNIEKITIKDASVSASFGVSSSQNNCFEFNELLATADKTVYLAKKYGRNRVVD